MTAWVAIVSGIVGAGAGAVGAYVALRRDARESRAQAVTEAEKTIALLEKQNEILEGQLKESKLQGEAREAEWKQREAEWKQRAERLERRITELERDYRNLVLTITTARYCSNAEKCNNYDPGDRRRHQPPTVGAEGTD